MPRTFPLLCLILGILATSCAHAPKEPSPARAQKPTYVIRRVQQAPALETLDWDAWEKIAETATLDHLWPTSQYRPKVSVRLVHDGTAIHGIFKVEDKYVLVTHVGVQKSVYKDACVEFFFRTDPARDEYVNLEMNAGGSYLFYTNIDPVLAEARGVKYCHRIPPEHTRLVRIRTSLPERIEPEITADTTWFLQFTLPLDALPPSIHRPDTLSGQHWTGNFYKCAGDCSHPHWLAWSPIPRRNFHIPDAFGTLLFE